MVQWRSPFIRPQREQCFTLGCTEVELVAPCLVEFCWQPSPVHRDLLRRYAIRLYWTPNFLLAPLQSTADALYGAVPDFGGYLLKIGSEKQGGVPSPATINAIAATLLRNGSVPSEANGE